MEMEIPGYQNARSTSLMMPSYGCLRTHLPRLKSTILAISYTIKKMKSLKEDSSCSVYSFSGLCYDQAVEHRSPSVCSILFALRREIFRLPSQSLGISTGYKTLPPFTCHPFDLAPFIASLFTSQPTACTCHPSHSISYYTTTSFNTTNLCDSPPCRSPSSLRSIGTSIRWHVRWHVSWSTRTSTTCSSADMPPPLSPVTASLQ